jgi:hypothetical protein
MQAKPFSLPDLEHLLDQAGFGKFSPVVKGSLLLFTAAKKSA